MANSETEKNGALPPQQARGLAEAVGYVTSAWLPVNEDVLERVRARLKNGDYDQNRTALLDDLKDDLSLFGHCLRTLEGHVDADAANLHPGTILRRVDLTFFHQLLTTSHEQLSKHRYEQTGQLQAQRVRHSLICCGAAELLAEKTSNDSDIAFSSALLRQLGFMLVAWNSPRTFQKALSALGESSGDLEKALYRFLGFSPVVLGYKCAVRWNQSPMLLASLGIDLDEPSPMSTHELKAAEEISHFCDIGEALARVSDPEHFQTGRREWDSVVHELEDYLGPNGLALVRDRIMESSATYKGLDPRLFEIDFSRKTSVSAAGSAHGAKLFAENTYVKKCPQHIQEALREVYDHVVARQVSVEALSLLVKTAIPDCGFQRGCIYLSEGDSTTVVPKLKIGEGGIERYKLLRGGNAQLSHPVLEALSCNLPIRQENAFMYGDMVSHVTGTFGNREKTGVLYLEMNSELAAAQNHVPLTYFKAIKQTLNDCLNLH